MKIKYKTVCITQDVTKQSYAEMNVGTQRHGRVEYARMRTDTTSQSSPVCQSRRYKTSLKNEISSRKRTKHFPPKNV